MAPLKKRVRHDLNVSEAVAAGKSWVLDMPLDIMLEIFNLLHPADLVSLCKTSKAFRSFLLDRGKCRKVWQTALDHAPMNMRTRKCPSFMSEPAYAKLLFDPLCHGCGTVVCETAKWNLRVRYVKNVLPQQLLDAGKAQWGKLFPTNRMTLSLMKLFLFPQKSLDPHFLLADIRHFQELCRGVEDPDALADIIDQRQRLTDAIAEHSKGWRKWETTMLRNIRQKRKQLILKNLRDLGYTQELKNMDARNSNDFGSLPVVHKGVPLDYAEWDQIEPILIRYMENYKVECDKKDLAKTYQPWFDFLRPISDEVSLGIARTQNYPCSPRTIDVSLLPEVRNILHDYEEMGSIRSVHAEKELRDNLPSLIKQWYDDALHKFQDHIRSQCKNGPDPFERAVQIFKCIQCHATLRGLSSMNHGCLYLIPTRNASSALKKWQTAQAEAENGEKTDFEIDWVAEYTAIGEDYFGSRPWNCAVLELEEDNERVLNIFKALREDPLTVSKQTMRNSNLRIFCNRCRHPPGKRVLMDWENVIKHCFKSHLNVEDSDVTWTLADSETGADIS
ncbi:hypothetical protein BJ138DRAFT_1013617 [Hygrophoropsis aurantiaca]|uniref:Uncharacterized protein n=1 Tax=Hygrophoropsis aurantiaca TaxID=72124 RepID=A0ACB8A4K9_9AGAM|nr:hypothetical protein BJ138DRAFT_1013617 [Hygrophoropsis aurantiaca]